MATTMVESPGIASAKEEAAAILYAKHSYQPVATPVISEEAERVEAKPARPTFTGYRQPEPIYNYKPDTTAFRPYKTFDEIKPTADAQVIRPYIDSNDYITSAAATTSVATPVVDVPAVVDASVPTVQSILDTELEENTQYVVKFKRSTVVAAAIIASIFFLMSVLCIVNIASLVSTSAQVGRLLNESSELQQTLTQKQMEWAEMEQADSGSVTNQGFNYQTSANAAIGSAETTDTSFFDWLCHSLSRLFG